ncbi:jg17798 [Pararge aegeria aegeria]|uniref:Jg17798 protein n=5 Tax=Pararge aegeria TaxID=116150 RepID=A0A8S4SKF5_9NEOP|nr:jg17798 [Pararge aegeria aegeria]
MDLNVEDYIESLFADEAFRLPSDSKKPEDIEMKIPEWYDEKEYNKARRFYWDNCFQLTSSMLLGLVAVFAIPSILRVLISSRRSNSTYTAYRRYLSTLLHTVSWFEHDLTPGSKSWKSLLAVRARHIKAGLSANLKGQGIVSQRDLALTQFGFVGFSILKPEKFGLQKNENSDWEAYNHFWRVIGHAIGLEDRYNICRRNIQETREVCQILLRRVWTPCLENVPEYYEHMARVMLDGLWCINPTIHLDSMIYLTKYLSDVPGYVYTEADRLNLQDRIREQLKGKSEDIGVDTASLISKAPFDLPQNPPRLLYLHDYDLLETVPPYKKLPWAAKYKLGLKAAIAALYTSYLGRIYFNMHFRFSLFLMKYFPYMAFFRFGVIKSYVRIFVEDPIDNEEPKPNSYYQQPQPPLPLYKELLSLLW